MATFLVTFLDSAAPLLQRHSPLSLSAQLQLHATRRAPTLTPPILCYCIGHSPQVNLRYQKNIE